MKKSYSRLEKIIIYARLMKNRAEQGNLSFFQQLIEILVLWIWRGQGPGYYQTAGFWRQEILWKNKISHMNRREYRTIVNKLNKQDYRKISQNKLSEKGMLSLFNIPQTPFIGYLKKKDGIDNKGDPLRTPEDLANLLPILKMGKICFKPTESWAGQGFHIVNIKRNNTAVYFTALNNDDEFTIEDYYTEQLGIDNGQGSIIEAYFDQHEWYSRLNPSSVNTFRLWVVQNAEITNTKLGYLRMGRAGSLVDNQSSGGIVAPIDLQTGVLNDAIDGLPARESWPNHPDTGTRIKGQRAPFFEESKALAERCITCFPGLHFAGVDVAVGPNGPIIIEMNVSPDREGAAFTDIPTKEVFI